MAPGLWWGKGGLQGAGARGGRGGCGRKWGVQLFVSNIRKYGNIPVGLSKKFTSTGSGERLETKMQPHAVQCHDE